MMITDDAKIEEYINSFVTTFESETPFTAAKIAMGVMAQAIELWTEDAMLGYPNEDGDVRIFEVKDEFLKDAFLVVKDRLMLGRQYTEAQASMKAAMMEEFPEIDDMIAELNKQINKDRVIN